jgi:hypothetical protein
MINKGSSGPAVTEPIVIVADMIATVPRDPFSCVSGSLSCRTIYISSIRAVLACVDLLETAPRSTFALKIGLHPVDVSP